MINPFKTRRDFYERSPKTVSSQDLNNLGEPLELRDHTYGWIFVILNGYFQVNMVRCPKERQRFFWAITRFCVRCSAQSALRDTFEVFHMAEDARLVSRPGLRDRTFEREHFFGHKLHPCWRKWRLILWIMLTFFRATGNFFMQGRAGRAKGKEGYPDPPCNNLSLIAHALWIINSGDGPCSTGR
jgi:hypothetical protein